MLAGTRLGPYEIVGPIGAGGMGEVFRARDTKLDRDVAVKLLPGLFAADPDRLARFEREARTLAALNHSNIAAIYGVEGPSPGSGTALVMELVEGEDLSAHIARGAMAASDALPIARQIADALEAAHEQGIIHRDLKPANIKIRPDGTVKVLDFGLAKALDPVGGSGVADIANSPTLTVRGTQMGMIIGTAAYMAPEQAKGHAVDRRADIWAFGVVLFEMLTGQRTFKGDDISEVLATVLKSDPDWNALPAETPASVRRLLRRCLEKDPRKRLRSIGDARLELDEPDMAVAAVAGPAAVRPARGLVLTATLVVVAIAATAGVMRWLTPPAGLAGPAGLARLSIALPDGDQVAETNLLPLAISPDGTRVAYVGSNEGGQRLFLRHLADAAPVAIAGTDGARAPFFSPDGQWIAFFAQGKVKKVSLGSAAVQLVSDGAPESRGGTWAPDGTIYFAPTNVSGLWKVPASGGTPTEFLQLDGARGEISHRWPQALPDGETLLFSAWSGPGPDERRIIALTIATGDRRVLAAGVDTARYLPTGYLTYGRLDTLLAVPWQPSTTLAADIVPHLLPERPRMENEGAADYALSSHGTLAYMAGGPARYTQRIVWVDRTTGAAEGVPVPDRDYEGIALSPDGQRAVVQVREGSMGLWLYDFGRRTLAPFATTGGSSQGAVWTPDGRRILYRGTRTGTRNLYWKAADGSDDEERLTTKEGVVHTPSSVSPDGGTVVFSEGGGPSIGGGDLWAMRLHGDRTPKLLLQQAQNGQISPGGKWIAYQSTKSG